MIGITLLIIVVSLLIYAYKKWVHQRNLYFLKRNIKFTQQSTLKGFYDILFRRLSMPEVLSTQYKEFPVERITGFSFLTPQYLIRDTDMIRKIFVKDFEFFEDHTQFFKTDNEPLLANTLISLTGEKWRAMRSTLSPAFTGSKMRQMFELVTEYTDETAKFLLAKSHNEKLNFEMKDFFSRYANDIIATCAFGLKVSSFIEPDNDFYVNARKLASNRSFSQTLKFLLLITAPKIAKALKIPVFDREYTAKFRSMILDTMHVRKMQNIHRPDMIHLLMQVRDGTLNHTIAEEAKTEGFATVEESDIGKQHSNRNWTDDELVAQCLLFFFAGLETVSTALTFAAYEIMVNQDVQQKLYDEISDTNERLGDKRISYDELQKMKYLDQVVCEVLRKWPPALQTERICVKDYQYDDGDKKFIIEKGKTVFIPTYGLHHDERHYPEPETFNPDRFSDENRSNINSSAYLPFGVGPRNCIGSRFALMEVKAILYYLLLNFTLQRNEKTVVPIVIEPMPQFGVKNGLHLELKPRDKK